MSEPSVDLVATIGTPQGGYGELEFENPSALASDRDGNLVVADTDNHRIVKLDAQGGFLWSVGCSNADGLPRPGTAQREFYSPQAVCTDTDGNIYVADSRNCRVPKLSPDSDFLTVFGTWGKRPGPIRRRGTIVDLIAHLVGWHHTEFHLMYHPPAVFTEGRLRRSPIGCHSVLVDAPSISRVAAV